MLDSCRLIFERSHFERSENEFLRSRFSDLLELNSCAKLQNWLLGSIEPSFLLCRDLKTRFYRTQKPDLTWMGSVQIRKWVLQILFFRGLKSETSQKSIYMNLALMHCKVFKIYSFSSCHNSRFCPKAGFVQR